MVPRLFSTDAGHYTQHRPSGATVSQGPPFPTQRMCFLWCPGTKCTSSWTSLHCELRQLWTCWCCFWFKIYASISRRLCLMVWWDEGGGGGWQWRTKCREWFPESPEFIYPFWPLWTLRQQLGILILRNLSVSSSCLSSDKQANTQTLTSLGHHVLKVEGAKRTQKQTPKLSVKDNCSNDSLTTWYLCSYPSSMKHKPFLLEYYFFTSDTICPFIFGPGPYFLNESGQDSLVNGRERIFSI